MTIRVRDYNENDPQDAERVAAMFNTWDSVWPGGFTRGVPETAQTVREQLARRRQLAVCVAEDMETGALVGHCNLEAQTGQTEIAYVPLLGANPDYHGRGVGKMLLREIVRRVTALGFRELTLGTWAGNLKAVPLYKKTGFMWEPDSSVHMVNFIPTILNLPQGKAFFANRDWYACQERELEVAPDDVTWQGMKVYRYRFRDGDEFLNVTIDAAGARVTAIETNEWAVSCSIGTDEAPAGEMVPIRWEIRPGAKASNAANGAKPLAVVLLAEGDSRLELRVQEQFEVSEPTTIERELRIKPDAHPPRWGQSPPRVRTTLIINGQPIALESGVKVMRPVEIEYGGEGLIPNRETNIRVTLRSRARRALTGTLVLDPSPGLEIAVPAQPISISANGWAECEYAVTANRPGVMQTQLRLETDGLSVTRPVAFRVLGQKPALASVDATHDETATLESSGLRVKVNLRGGGLEVRTPDRRFEYGQQRLGEAGPPFGGHRSAPPLLESRIESAPDGSDIVTLVAPSTDFPGLVVERAVAFLTPNIVQVTHRVANRSDRAQKTQFQLSTTSWRGHRVAAPLPTGERGILHEPMRNWGDFPSGDHDLLPPGSTFSEQWLAYEEDGTVCGLVWHPGAKEDMQWSRFPNFTYDLGELPPHSIRELAPVYFVCGSGDWQTVREEWKRLVRPSLVGEDPTPPTTRVLTVTSEPTTPAFLRDGQDTIPVTVRSRRGKAFDGTLTVGKTEEGKTEKAQEIEVEAGRWELTGVDRAKPFTASVRVIGIERPGATLVPVRLDAGPQVERFTIPIVAVGSGEPDSLTVEESANGEYMIANGLLTMRVAPAFYGSLYALETDGINHLFSAYPTPRAFAWWNPWHGGLVTQLGGNHSDEAMARATYTGRAIERIGETGIAWRGASVSCVPGHKEWDWLRIETEYLTTGGSNLVAVAQRFVNRSGATKRLNVGMRVWTQPGGARENVVAHWEREGERRERRNSSFGSHHDTSGWGALENATTGHVLLCAVTGRDGQLTIDDAGVEGAHLNPYLRFELAPGATRETLTWLVVTRDRAQIAAYAHLKECADLP